MDYYQVLCRTGGSRKELKVTTAAERSGLMSGGLWGCSAPGGRPLHHMTSVLAVGLCSVSPLSGSRAPDGDLSGCDGDGVEAVLHL